MIDIELLRKNPQVIKEAVTKRGMDVDVDHLLVLDEEFRHLTGAVQKVNEERNQLKGPENKDRGRELKETLSELNAKLEGVETERFQLLSNLPNILAPDTPPGKSDEDNVELRQIGDLPKFSFEPKIHEALGIDLGILDLERGAKVAGSGFYYWKGDGARLINALMQCALDFLHKKNFTQFTVPILAKERSLYGTGYLPFFPDDIYKIEGQDLSLIGTSEQTLVGYHADDIIPAGDLPLHYAAYSPCFRTEAGSYGKEARGIFRVHQFSKIEQIIFCKPDDSEKYHEESLKNEEEFMQLLALPYRVVRICVGDMGAPGYKKYDLETWFAGFAAWRETHSTTNLLDYQTRRLNIRSKEDSKIFYPHTISATMITDRAALAILENNQTADGSIIIPEALRPYMAGQQMITKKT